MSSKTPGDLRTRYGDRDPAWLRENLPRFKAWKRVEIEKLIKEKEGDPEPLRIARSDNRWAKAAVAIAVLALVAAIVMPFLAG